MKKQWSKKRKTLVAIALLLMALVAIGVSAVVYNGKRAGIEVPEGRTEYIARVGIPDVTPGLPMRAHENLEATNTGFVNDQDGRRGAQIIFYKTVFPPSIDRSGFGQTGNAISADQSAPFDVFIGDTFEYDGYTFKLTTIDARDDHDSYAGFVILELPPDVTVFPSGDPANW